MQGERHRLSVVDSVIGVIERTDNGERVVFDVDMASEVCVPMPAADLMEMLGALLDNAARHARRSVRITGGRDSKGVCLTIEDDGPGIGAERVDDAMVRGGRFDENSEGGLRVCVAWAASAPVDVGG